ncbi:MAG: tetraacyldisaccharide 4'-kinase, partial [bacterium]|nr:tetraacyldisaccharide 4'-kinase [bacterium]
MIFFNFIKILLLWPLSLLYWIIVELRTFGYKNGLIRSHKASVPVISIGNIAAGGTGKTPMAIYVARVLLDNDVRVAVLSRGYKRKTKSSHRGSHRKCGAGGVPLLRQNQKANTQVVSDGISILCPAEEAGDEPFLMASRLL